MGIMTEYSAAVVVAWSLFVLLVGYLWGSRKAKQPTDDRARLDRPPPPLPPKQPGPSELSPEARAQIEAAVAQRAMGPLEAPRTITITAR